MAAASAISPELVLVCPELAASARALLPDVDPDALFEWPRRAEPAEGVDGAPREASSPPRDVFAAAAPAPLPLAMLVYGLVSAARLVGPAAAVGLITGLLLTLPFL